MKNNGTIYNKKSKQIFLTELLKIKNISFSPFDKRIDRYSFFNHTTLFHVEETFKKFNFLLENIIRHRRGIYKFEAIYNEARS